MSEESDSSREGEGNERLTWEGINIMNKMAGNGFSHLLQSNLTALVKFDRAQSYFPVKWGKGGGGGVCPLLPVETLENVGSTAKIVFSLANFLPITKRRSQVYQGGGSINRVQCVNMVVVYTKIVIRMCR